ncbi:MAG: hypothetical protein ACP5NP_00300 [Acetobacteraceae bacterium]
MFTDAQKTDIRRYCGYPAYGATPAGFDSWRFFQVYGLLEFRLNNLSTAETNVVLTYLAQLAALEFAVPKAGDSMDTDQASIWTRNRNEARDRAQLFDDWRRRLCGFLGVPPGPALRDGGISWIV